MHRRVIHLLTLLAIACTANAALAQQEGGPAAAIEQPALSTDDDEQSEQEPTGRWGVRLEIGPFAASGYFELVVMRVANVELGSGIMARYRDGIPFEVTPYTVLALYQPRYFVTLEASVPVRLLPQQRIGFSAAVSVGGRF